MKLLIELLVLAYLLPACLLGYAYALSFDEDKLISNFEMWKIMTKIVLVALFWPVTWPIVWWYSK